MSLRCTINAFGLFPIQITSWSTQRMTQSRSSSSLRCPVLSIFQLFMCETLLLYRRSGPTKVSQCLCNGRSSVTSCFSEAPTRRSLTHAGRASLLSRSPWKTGWARKARQGHRSLSVSVGLWQGASSMSCFLMQLHGKKQHIRALLIDRVLLQHEVSWTQTLCADSQM